MQQAIHILVYLLEQDTETTETIRKLCNEKSIQLQCYLSHDELIDALDNSRPSCIIAATDSSDDRTLDILDIVSKQNQGYTGHNSWASQ